MLDKARFLIHRVDEATGHVNAMLYSSMCDRGVYAQAGDQFADPSSKEFYLGPATVSQCEHVSRNLA